MGWKGVAVRMGMPVLLKRIGLICTAAFILGSLSACKPSKPTDGSSSETSQNAKPSVDNFVYAEALDIYPNDGEDDYPAVSKALSEGKNIWFDAGVYEFSQTLSIKDQTLSGAGMMVTTLQYTSSDKGALIRAEGACRLTDLMLSVKEALLTGNEQQGEYVLLWCGDATGLSKGTVVQNVGFDACGTAVYAPPDKREAVSDSIFDTLEIKRFTYRGFDLRSPDRTGMQFSNLYVSHGYLGNTETNADAAFALEGGDSGTVIHQLNVEHMMAKRPVILSGCRELQATAIHIEGITVGQSDSGFMHVDKTSGRIDALTVFYSAVDYDRVSVLQFGDAEDSDALEIGVLHLKGLNDPNAALHGARKEGLLSEHGKSFLMMSRQPSAKGSYTVGIDSYVFFTFKSDRDVYDRFDTAGNITFTRIGVLTPSGPTQQRPRVRLCKGYTTYFDTTLGSMLVWNGSAWERIK